jgi:hypothetical protein
MSIWAPLERRHGEGNDAHPDGDPMAHAPRKNTWNEQLWNVSLLPTVAPPRPVQATTNGPTPQDRGSALRMAALLSLVESEAPTTLAQAA